MTGPRPGKPVRRELHNPYRSELTPGDRSATAVLRALCQPSAVEAVARVEVCDERCLESAERELVATAVLTRRQEFATVRCCARAAMTRLGGRPWAVLPRGDGPAWARRAPRWPPGVVGSMTHCDHFYGAALAADTQVAALGIDAEVNAVLPAELHSMVLLPEERDAVEVLFQRSPEIAWDRLVFSAKESVYKAWYPATGGWLDFHDCAVQIDVEHRQFFADVRVVDPTKTFDMPFVGWWHADSDQLVTALVVPRAGRPPLGARGEAPARN